MIYKLIYFRSHSNVFPKESSEVNDGNENEGNDVELSGHVVEHDKDTSIPLTGSTPDNSVNTVATNFSQNDEQRTPVYTTQQCSTKKKDNTGKILEILQNRSNQREVIMKNFRERNIEEDDPTLMFFKSMAMTVKSFPPELIVEAKSRVYEIVSTLELQSIRQSKQQFPQELPTNFPDSPFPGSRPGTSYSGTTSNIGSYLTTFSPGNLSLSSDNDYTHL